MGYKRFKEKSVKSMSKSLVIVFAFAMAFMSCSEVWAHGQFKTALGKKYAGGEVQLQYLPCQEETEDRAKRLWKAV